MKLPDIEIVSAKVHEAWMDSKRAQGVTTRKAEDGEELMVPYAELTDKAKELDRGTVRAVYQAIAATVPDKVDGVALVAEERSRQIEKEGWTPEHDDDHDTGELALAAALYAAPFPLYQINHEQNSIKWTDPWPWHDYEEGARGGSHRVTAWDKRKTHPRQRQLVIAGALIAAEIDRLLRKEL